MLKRFVHAIRPRLTELHARGVVKEAGMRFEVVSQRHETVWQLTGKIPTDQMELF